MKVGVFPGRFLPPHRGHLTGILRAHALCSRLFVVISERQDDDGELCRQAGIPYISGAERLRWLSQELYGLEITIKLVDEKGIPPFPEGWAGYSDLVRSTVGRPINLIFGGEARYVDDLNKYFPEAEYRLLDPNRTKWNISGTEIREHPYRHWEYIVGAARPFFAKRVLITGPESAGKTTITKKLAKVFYTSWSEEVGRTYQEDVLGGDGSLFNMEDFNRIAHLQYEQDLRALETASKVCFFDTDAVVTHFFSAFFMGKIAERIDSFIDPAKYDLVLALRPTVPFVDDGMRDTGEGEQRHRNFEELMRLYQSFGFDMTKFVVIGEDNYYDRLEACIREVDKLISPPGVAAN